jgi:ribulose-bisphosphate carboxylase large chain
MVEAYSGFVNTKYVPKKTDLLAEFTLDQALGVSFQTAAEAVAGESSIGTWTTVSTLTPEIVKKLRPSIYHMDRLKRTIRIAYPAALFEEGNIPQVLSSVAGNVFGMNIVKNLRLEDIRFPESYYKTFKGPNFGMNAIRKRLKIKDRPLLGTIVKPKVGLSANEHANVAYTGWFGGCDVVKDDENLANMSFNKFSQRVTATLKQKDRAERKTGEKKVYLPNVTAETKEMLKRARLVKERGGKSIMVDVLTVGFSALQTLRNANIGLVIHGHRAMHGAITRNPKHGISMVVLAKICRLIGMDQLHIGAIYGKMTGSSQEVVNTFDAAEKTVITPKPKEHVLGSNWGKIKPMFAVCSGGLYPGATPPLLRTLGKNIIIQMGGGIHGHPGGTIVGASAAREAIEAHMKGIKLREYAKLHKALRVAIEKWGVVE